MSRRLGRVGFMDVSFDDGTSWARLGDVVEINISTERDSVDNTTHDDGGHRRKLHGLAQSSGGGNLMYNDSDPTQLNMWQALQDETNIRIRYIPVVVTSTPRFECAAVMTGWDMGAPLEDMQTIDFSFDADGRITRALQ